MSSRLIGEGRFAHDKFLHLLLQPLIDRLLVADLLLVHLDFLGLNRQLLAHGVCTLAAYLAHLAVLEHALKLLNSLLQRSVLFLHNHVLLAHSEKLGLSLVELVPQLLQLCLLLLIRTDQRLRVLHHRREVD